MLQSFKTAYYYFFNGNVAYPVYLTTWVFMGPAKGTLWCSRCLSRSREGRGTLKSRSPTPLLPSVPQRPHKLELLERQFTKPHSRPSQQQLWSTQIAPEFHPSLCLLVLISWERVHTWRHRPPPYSMPILITAVRAIFRKWNPFMLPP